MKLLDLALNKKSLIRTKVPTVGSKVPTAKPTVAAVKGNRDKAVKALACWIWRPKQNQLDQGSNLNGVSVIFKKYNYIDTQGRPKSVMAWERITKKRMKNEAKTTKPDSEWKSKKKTKSKSKKSQPKSTPKPKVKKRASRIGKQDAIDATLMGMLADPKEVLEVKTMNLDEVWKEHKLRLKKPEKETKKEGSGIELLLGLIEGFYDQAAYKEFVKTVRIFLYSTASFVLCDLADVFDSILNKVCFELVFKSIKLSMLRITEAAPPPFIAKIAVTGSLFPFLNSYLDGMIGSQPTSAIEFTLGVRKLNRPAS
ncbi:hypothetical protein Tco_0555720 [Tanacetum coccineum]